MKKEEYVKETRYVSRSVSYEFVDLHAERVHAFCGPRSVFPNTPVQLGT